MTFRNITTANSPGIRILVALWFAASASTQMATAMDAGATAIPAAPASPEHLGENGEKWNWHAQSTIIGQGYASFSSRYSGANSLPGQGQARETVSLDLYGGYRLWKGAEFHVDLLTWQGFGLHGTLGIDDFPNGEAYKVGTRSPHSDIARFFIRQTIGLGGEKEALSSDQLTLAAKQQAARLTFTAGRFSAKDVFDTNAYANDPRTQFMNWALVANIAWDYPADSLGYTTGATVELQKPRWALRYGFFQLPNQRNGLTAEGHFLMWPGDGSAGDLRFFHHWGMAAENEHRYRMAAHRGAVRALAYLNQGEFGSYKAALSVAGTDISKTFASRHSYGFGLNAEQELTKNIGVYSRVGWNDGHNEAWMFSDANHSGSIGLSIKGELWRLPRDSVGLGGVTSGISDANRKFLKAGGQGILDGDGTLDYRREFAAELYYDHALKQTHVALDYQFVANPAFNRARGPVSIFGTRIHWEF